MIIIVNRDSLQVSEGTTVSDLVRRYEVPEGAVVVAVNDHVVPRETWPGHELQPDDEIDIVRAVSGGDHMPDDTLVIAGHTFSTRLFLGTGKYADAATMAAAVRASGAEMVTVAVRHMNLNGEEASDEPAILDVLREIGVKLLPNTAGAYTVRDAVKMARLARAATGTEWIKLEVIGDRASLWPDVAATVEATRILVEEGFVVLPYVSADVVVAHNLEAAGAATVMPLASPIGSGQGMQDWASIRRVVEAVSLPVVVDAGIGAPSDAALAMELGASAVLVNTAIAKASVPVAMADGMRLGVQAGRAAWRAGRMARRDDASPSSPVEGVPLATRA